MPLFTKNNPLTSVSIFESRSQELINRKQPPATRQHYSAAGQDPVARDADHRADAAIAGTSTALVDLGYRLADISKRGERRERGREGGREGWLKGKSVDFGQHNDTWNDQ